MFQAQRSTVISYSVSNRWTFIWIAFERLAPTSTTRHSFLRASWNLKVASNTSTRDPRTTSGNFG